MTVCGKKEEFAPVRQAGGMTVISYGYREIEGTDLANWEELIFYKMRDGKMTLDMVKSAVWNDINAKTDAKILNGYEWEVLHGEDAGSTVKVWLSAENQENFKAKHDLALAYPQLTTWPVTYKISEHTDKSPVYEHFANIEELARFYLGGVAYIEQTLQEGWQKKGTFDFTPYELILNPVTENENAGEE